MEYNYDNITGKSLQEIADEILAIRLEEDFKSKKKEKASFSEIVPKKEGTTICTVCYRPVKECICGI